MFGVVVFILCELVYQIGVCMIRTGRDGLFHKNGLEGNLEI